MPDPIHARSTPWKTIILTCGKCSRKLDGGFGPKGDDTLRAVLKTELRERGHKRDVRLIETKCLGLCPKRAVVAINATAADRVLTISGGTSAADALSTILGNNGKN